MKNIYLSFLALVEALQGETDALSSIDLEAKKLLEVIAVKHSEGDPLKVMDAMRLDDIASPATIHRKLTQLAQVGLIDMEHRGTNRRKKYLVPTQAAEKYFDRVGEAMAKAVTTN